MIITLRLRFLGGVTSSICKAFSFSTEKNKFVQEVANAGYATDSSYENKLIKVMSGCDLYEGY